VAQKSTKLIEEEGKKLENMRTEISIDRKRTNSIERNEGSISKNEKESKSTSIDEEDIASTTTAVTIYFTCFFLANRYVWSGLNRGTKQGVEILGFGVGGGFVMIGKWNECGWGI
jgi:hypothetical protein